MLIKHACAALVVSWLLSTDAYGADQVSSHPVPRIETGSHSEFIKKAGIDGMGRTLLTVSDDRTARIWDAASGAALATVRVPIGPLHEGQLYAGALSSDGSLAALAGYTLYAGRPGSSVYVYRLATGQLGPISGLPSDTIDNLQFSPDGRFLAVCFSSREGVVLIDMQTQRLAMHDRDYADHILGIDFSPDGDLLTTSSDGTVRKYDAANSYRLEHRVQLQDGKEPMHARYSPDGREVVVGFDGTPAYVILSADDLRVLHRWHAPEGSLQRGLHVVEWSSDGRYVFAAGETDANQPTPLYRIDQQGRGVSAVMPGARRRVSDIRRFPDDSILVTSGEPSISRIGVDGKVMWHIAPDTPDLIATIGRLQLDTGGSRVSFRVDASRDEAMSFDMLAPPERALANVPPVLIRGDVAPMGDFISGLFDWRDSRKPILGGRPLDLDSYETSLSATAVPNTDLFVLGTSWNLRGFSQQGEPSWRTALASQALETTTDPDGRYLVAALSDGTIRWYRPEDGEEIAALFVQPRTSEWIAWIPAGYYMSSSGGDELLGWSVNRGLDRAPDFYRAIQFERDLFRPDVVQAYFRSRGMESASAIQGFDIADLDSIAPPRLQVMEVDRSASHVRFEIHAEATSSLAMEEFGIYSNEVPLLRQKERRLGANERRQFRRTVEVPLRAGRNQLRVEAFNGRTMGLLEQGFQGATREVPVAPGDLYVLSIGVSEFTDSRIADLRYAARDAEVLAAALGHAAAELVANVHTRSLFDVDGKAPTRAQVLDALDFIQQAGPDDTVIVFLASHGISDSKGNYYFVPGDADFDEVAKIEAGDTTVKTMVPWQAFFDLLRGTAGRRLLIVDTCQSANMQGSLDVFSLAKRSASSRFALVAASRGSELSQEYDPGKHGLFTYGLIQSLQKGHDEDGDGVTTLAEVFSFAQTFVQEKYDRTAPTAQTPVILAPEVLLRTPLALSRNALQ